MTTVPSGGMPALVVDGPDGVPYTLTIRPLLPGEPVDPAAPPRGTIALAAGLGVRRRVPLLLRIGHEARLPLPEPELGLPVGPLRCLASLRFTISPSESWSSAPRSFSRHRNITRSLSCSIEPDSRRSDRRGSLDSRISAWRDSWLECDDRHLQLARERLEAARDLGHLLDPVGIPATGRVDCISCR